MFSLCKDRRTITHSCTLFGEHLNIYDIKIISKSEAYAVVSPGFGGAGRILKYNGNTWTTDYLYADMGTELFYGLGLANSEIYAVGAGGLIKKKNTVSNTSIKKINSKNSNLFYTKINSNRVYIQNNTKNGLMFNIHNSKGEKLLNSTLHKNQSIKLDVSKYPKGIYYLNLKASNLNQTKTFRL